LVIFLFVGTLSWQNYADSREPWKPTNNTGLRILWWMFEKVRVHHRLALLYGNLWLPQPVSHHRWKCESSCDRFILFSDAISFILGICFCEIHYFQGLDCDTVLLTKLKQVRETN